MAQTTSSIGAWVDPRRVSPTKVLSASAGIKLAVLASLPISGIAWSWLYSLYPQLHGVGLRSEWFCALTCVYAVFVSCWVASFAYIVRKRNWSPKTCHWAGWPFLVFTLILWICGHAADASTPAILSLATGAWCRKLAYPAITDKQMVRAEPPPPGVF